MTEVTRPESGAQSAALEDAKARLAEINTLIFAGAPLGSNHYFRIRELTTKPLVETPAAPTEPRYATCIWCNNRIEYQPGDDEGQSRAYQESIQHDLVCEKSPLVAQVAKLMKTLEEVEKQAGDFGTNIGLAAKVAATRYDWEQAHKCLDEARILQGISLPGRCSAIAAELVIVKEAQRECERLVGEWKRTASNSDAVVKKIRSLLGCAPEDSVIHQMDWLLHQYREALKKTSDDSITQKTQIDAANELLARVQMLEEEIQKKDRALLGSGLMSMQAQLDQALARVRELEGPSKPFTKGSRVIVYDRYRFAIPLEAVVVSPSDANDGVLVSLQRSNNGDYPIGAEIWVHAAQLRHKPEPPLKVKLPPLAPGLEAASRIIEIRSREASAADERAIIEGIEKRERERIIRALCVRGDCWVRHNSGDAYSTEEIRALVEPSHG